MRRIDTGLPSNPLHYAGHGTSFSMSQQVVDSGNNIKERSDGAFFVKLSTVPRIGYWSEIC